MLLVDGVFAEDVTPGFNTFAQGKKEVVVSKEVFMRVGTVCARKLNFLRRGEPASERVTKFNYTPLDDASVFLVSLLNAEISTATAYSMTSPISRITGSGFFFFYFRRAVRFLFPP